MKKNRLIALFAALVMLAVSLPLTALAETYATIISQDALHLRDEPSTDGAILGQYRRGTRVEILTSKARNWQRVRTPDGKTGYMYKKYLSTYTRTESKETKITRYVRAADGGPVNLRRRASTKATLMARIPSGTQVTVLSSGTVWTRVLYKGKDGWILTKFIKKK